ncbi:heme exporter protein CcmD [Thiohalocapsa sp. ML1]|jgi:heme exporter protein D|uniref:heme exporter protein CcmD n=1 Tax=Thiohalocapsa sp. ML1 TaxID=1431688 RepID=UPI000732073C|nr:heme exporter protein CcmD [Thiohalocapsa sp. ML1]
MQDFLGQGGFAFYVWSAFGMTFGLLLAEVLVLRRHHRTILQRVGRLVRLRKQNQPPGEPK